MIQFHVLRPVLDLTTVSLLGCMRKLWSRNRYELSCETRGESILDLAVGDVGRSHRQIDAGPIASSCARDGHTCNGSCFDSLAVFCRCLLRPPVLTSDFQTRCPHLPCVDKSLLGNPCFVSISTYANRCDLQSSGGIDKMYLKRAPSRPGHHELYKEHTYANTVSCCLLIGPSELLADKMLSDIAIALFLSSYAIASPLARSSLVPRQANSNQTTAPGVETPSLSYINYTQ